MTETTVADMPSEQLVGRVVRYPRAAKRGGIPRWIWVKGLFSLGSAYSRQLCLMYGCDPDEMVRRHG